MKIEHAERKREEIELLLYLKPGEVFLLGERAFMVVYGLVDPKGMVSVVALGSGFLQWFGGETRVCLTNTITRVEQRYETYPRGQKS